MTSRYLLVTAFSAAVSATSASADGFEFGGYVQLEYYGETGDFGDFREYEADLTLNLGYKTGPWYFGVGQYFEYSRFEDDFSSDTFTEDNDPYLMIGYDAFLLSYGELQGAGNIFPESYFGFTDTTSFSDNTLRLDVAMGAFSSYIEHLAISVDNDDEDLSDGLEVGIRLNFNDTIVGIGWEGDSDDLGIIVARDFGDYRVHAVFHDDGEGDKDIGFSAFREIGDFEVGANIEFEVGGDGGDEGVEAIGLVAYYETPIGLLNAQLRREYDGDYTVIEVGFLIPFGNQAPFSEYRTESADNLRRFGY